MTDISHSETRITASGYDPYVPQVLQASKQLTIKPDQYDLTFWETDESSREQIVDSFFLSLR